MVYPSKVVQAASDMRGWYRRRRQLSVGHYLPDAALVHPDDVIGNPLGINDGQLYLRVNL